MKDTNQDWLKLDNAAKIYPATSSRKSPAQFRLSVTLKKPVNYKSLQNAWSRMIQRCPYYQVYLQRGFFWYYLQKHQEVPPIQLLEPVPRQTFDPRQKSSHLIRISIRENIIALDFSHILTDGNGGFRFLLGLIYEYLNQQGLPGLDNIPNPDEKPKESEYEDAFLKYFSKQVPHPPKLSSAYHLPGKPKRNRKYKIIEGKIPLDRLLALTKANKVTITDFLTANYIYSLKEIYLLESKITKPNSSLIRLQVPVNMRKIYPSHTMRNFSLYVSPEINLKLGNFTFAEILKRVHHTMKLQVDQKELGRQVARNVGGELNPLVRIIPLFAKNIYLGNLYSRLGEICYSGVLSNLGQISIPDAVKDHVETFSVSVVPNNVMKKSCTVLSYQNDLIINFSSAIESVDMERLFFTNLVQKQIPVSVREL